MGSYVSSKCLTIHWAHLEDIPDAVIALINVKSLKYAHNYCFVTLLYEHGLMRNRPNQIIINKYKPGGRNYSS